MTQTDKKLENIFMAKLAEQTERFEDMILYMKNVLEGQKELKEEERNLFSIAYKNAVGQKRTAWRAISAYELQDKQKETSEMNIIKQYKLKIENEIEMQCNEALGQIDKQIIFLENSQNFENKVFFQKMKGDYFRYLSEFQQGEKHFLSSQNAHSSYREGLDLAEKELKSTNSIRLGIALNYSVFFYEVMNDLSQACNVSKKAFDSAISDLDNLEDEQYRDSTSILQLIRDNLTIWTNEQNEVKYQKYFQLKQRINIINNKIELIIFQKQIIIIIFIINMKNNITKANLQQIDKDNLVEQKLTRPINIKDPTDYREISKTLQSLQQNCTSFSPINQQFAANNSKGKQNELFDFQALQSSGILSKNFKQIIFYLSQNNLDHLRMDDEEQRPGSLDIQLEDIEKAFKILDEKNNGQKISLQELKKKIPIINPSFPINDIQSLTNGKQEIKAKELHEILQNNELEDLDLFKEAFGLLDPLKTGNLDTNRLKQIFSAFGYGDINKKDMEILTEALDIDGDGKISINDLQKVFEQSEMQIGFQKQNKVQIQKK